jgi:alpha-L-fucosidase
MEDARLGIIVHWGVYSVPAFDVPACARRRRIMNGSEWYLHRLNATYRIGPAERATRAYHAGRYPGETYADLAHRFTAEAWDPVAWASLFARAGAEYVVLTAKHHDGFCLWPTHTAPGWNAGDVGPRRDVVRELRDAVVARELCFGLYYSWHEWSRDDSRELCDRAYVRDVVEPQLRELAAYEPSVLWFDGDWPRTARHWRAQERVRELVGVLPSLAVNDRLGRRGSWQALTRADGSPLPSFRSFADRTTPDVTPTSPSAWERVDTIGLSWGRNEQQLESDYKSIDELVGMLVDVACKGGRLLLNVGPDARGSICATEAARLEGLGEWLRVHGEAIYGTQPGPEPLTTRRGDTTFRFERSAAGAWTHRIERDD